MENVNAIKEFLEKIAQYMINLNVQIIVFILMEFVMEIAFVPKVEKERSAKYTQGLNVLKLLIV